MPLYEYECQACHHHFELLVRESTRLECPKCASADLARQLSVFAVGAEGGRAFGRDAAPAPCGACGDPGGAGSCRMN